VIDDLLARAVSDAERRLEALRSAERVAVSVKALFVRDLVECLRTYGTTAGLNMYGNLRARRKR